MHKYTLQPYSTPSSRFRCPECRHRTKSFTRYIDTETNEYLASHVGRCGREDKCGYHYKPRDYFRDNPGVATSNYNRNFEPRNYAKRHTQPEPEKQPEMHYYIHTECVNASFKCYNANNFVQYLISTFGLDEAAKMVARYRIGTSKHWHGATVFWQLDTEGLVRTGKIMLYSKTTGKRVKEPFNHITWAHSVILASEQLAVGSGQSANFHLRQCLFGEHLLTEEPGKPVAIVESEKTAIIASGKAPGSIWLAAGSASNLNPEICQVLANRRVTLYPDLGAYEKWKAKARELQTAVKGSVFTVSTLLERLATDHDRQQGFDIVDFL